MFSDKEFCSSINMSGVNSINWSRIAAQVVYYFWAYLQVDQKDINFIVPSGNFGNVFCFTEDVTIMRFRKHPLFFLRASLSRIF